MYAAPSGDSPKQLPELSCIVVRPFYYRHQILVFLPQGIKIKNRKGARRGTADLLNIPEWHHVICYILQNILVD